MKPLNSRLRRGNASIASYRRISEHLAAEIANGNIPPGGKLPSEAETARRFGVTRMTASAGYAELERRGLIVQRRGLGSYALPPVEELAPDCRRVRSIVIAIAIDDAGAGMAPEARFFFQEVLLGVNAVLGAAGVPVSCLAIGHAPETLTEATVRSLAEFDGVLYFGCPAMARECGRHFIGRPFVDLLGWTRIPGGASVHCDRAGAARLAARHLMECGYRRVGLLGFDDREQDGANSKFAAFRDEAARLGLRLEERDCLMPLIRPGETHRAVLERVRAGDLPEAFFAFNDLGALDALHAFQGMGLSVPGDVGLMGYDDLPESAMSTPPLTTIHAPRREVGRFAAKLVLDWPAEPQPAMNVLFETRLVVRGTTRPAPRGGDAPAAAGN